MKNILLNILLNILPILIFAQVNYFNERFDYNITGIWDNSRSLLEIDGGYVIGGMTGGQDIFWYHIALRKIDFQGNEIWTKTLGEPNKQYWIGEPGSLIATSDGGYLMCGTYKDNSVIVDAALLIKYDENFDTIWTNKRFDTITPSNYLYYYFQCKEIINEGYIIIGVKKPYGEPSKMHLVKTDYNGNIIWEKVYGTGSYYYQTFSIILTTDGGFAIGGYRFLIGPSQVDADPIIYKADSLGTLEWEKNLGGPLDDYHPMLTLSNDGNIIVGTSICDSMITPSDPMRKTFFVKLNNEGDVLWEKYYGSSVHYNSLLNIRTVENDGYIAAGYLVADFPHRSGWLMKINENGDSIWYRQYDNLLGDESRNYLYDVIPTSDNGYAACGYVIPYAPDTGSQDAWVLKVDSMGCDTPGCFTTAIPELSPSMRGQGEELKIWPNPATATVTLRHSKCEEGEGLAKGIIIYNSQGLKVEEIKVPDGVESLQVDVSKYTNGLYYLQYIHSNQIIETAKFIKN